MSIRDVFSSFLLSVRSRPIVFFVYSLPTFWSYLIATWGTGGFSFFEALIVFSSVSSMALSVYFFNDLSDLEDDLKNQELGNPAQALRVLGRDSVSKSRFKQFIIFTGILGLVLAYSINFTVFVLQVLNLTLGYLYSAEPIRLKKRFLMKQFTIALGTTFCILIGAVAGGGVISATLYMGVIHFIVNMGINPIMDVRDMRGDRIMGIRTIPVVWGPAATVRLYFASFFVMGIATFLGYAQLGLNAALPILVSLILVAWLYVSIPLLKKWNDPIFLNSLIIRRVVPFYCIMQLVTLVGIMRLPF
ncbi:MAG: UbiA family prenyltransferase [Candidatus Bathyarchaeia archaeon]